VTDQKHQPVLDEQTFERLLEAAFVLQEHNRKMRELEKSLESQSEQLREQELANQALLQKTIPLSEEENKARSTGDYTLTLAEIVEAQHQIQMRHLELDKAMAVVAERVARITTASGSGIGLVEGKMVHYRAGAGPPSLPAGSEVPLQTAVCQANIRTGQVIRTPDVDTEFLFDPEPCRQRGILSLVAVPIHHDGNIVGALELYFDRVKGFAEQDIHTCQLMAGLVTEAIGRDAGLKLKKSMAAERSTMLAAIEKLKPNLAAAVQARPGVAANPAGSESTAAIVKTPCWKCGNKLVAEEQFCGKCGAPSASNAESSSMQSKVASAWHAQQNQETLTASASESGVAPESVFPRQRWNEGNPDDEETIESLMETSPRPEEGGTEALALRASATHDLTPTSASSESLDEENIESASTALVKPQSEELIWSSTEKALDFLESLSATRNSSALARFWRSRRGDFYLALAVVLVGVVIRWGIWSDNSVGATGHGTAISGSASRRRPAPDADLSLFDKLLIGLGLAEAPETPEYKGNPDTQVWVDLNTALYYCPGSDLYGKTAKGKLSSQREAQLDQFEPANRKACN